MDWTDFHEFFRLIEDDALSLFYRGDFADEITTRLIDLSESHFKEGKEQLSIRKKVSFLMAECFQNVIRYGEEMASEDHVQGQSHVFYLVHQFEYEGGIGKQDVGEVLFRMGHDGFTHLVIKPFQTGIVLPEGVAGKKDLILLGIGKHAVGPVEHPGFHKGQRSFPDAQFPPIVHRLVVPFLREVL